MMVRIDSQALISKRKERKYSQRKLSISAGLSDNAVFRMENEDYSVNILRAKAVAEALKCDLCDIIKRE